MANTQEMDELEAWALFLREIPISQPEETAWREFFESILAQPRTYSSAILTAAMERYGTLIGEAGSPIMEDAATLGLPTVS